jgi:hypothetical protein
VITTYLVEHPWLSPLAMLVLVVLGTPAGVLLRGRPHLARGLLALSVLSVAALTLAPSGSPAFPGCEVAWSAPTPGRVELAANVVLFVAPALLLGVLLRRPFVALVAASATSAAIELTQSTVTVLDQRLAVQLARGRDRRDPRVGCPPGRDGAAAPRRTGAAHRPGAGSGAGREDQRRLTFTFTASDRAEGWAASPAYTARIL